MARGREGRKFTARVPRRIGRRRDGVDEDDPPLVVLKDTLRDAGLPGATDSRTPVVEPFATYLSGGHAESVLAVRSLPPSSFPVVLCWA
jgi:hypothetical protein